MRGEERRARRTPGGVRPGRASARAPARAAIAKRPTPARANACFSPPRWSDYATPESGAALIFGYVRKKLGSEPGQNGGVGSDPGGSFLLGNGDCHHFPLK